MSPETRLKLVIAGGGVAGLEAVLALRALAADRLDVTMIAPEAEFTYRPMSVAHPFARGHASRHQLTDIAQELGFELVRASVTSVDAGAHEVTTSDGAQIGYDVLLVAVGAGDEPAVEHALTWTPKRDADVFGGLLRDIEEGYSKEVAFVVPPSVAWPLPAYELALMTGWAAREAGQDVAFAIHTPELAPLAIFGEAATQSLQRDLDELGIAVHTGVVVEDARDLDARRVVALPRAVGRAPDGLPLDERGFIRTDAQCTVIGLDDVYAAGDATAFPVKQGGIAAQQADAAAEAIARRAGADVQPQPFRPVLRGVLLTGRGREWLRHDLGDDNAGESSRKALFWPPTKVAGRYLSPYLARLDAAPEASAAEPEGELVDLDLT